MKRVVVIGSGGAGKSTFSQNLAEATGLPVIHLDSIYWKPNWQETSAEEWKATIAEMVNRDAWIMDGNYGATRQRRIEASDTVIFLDIPRLVCVYRVIKRAIKYRGKSRPDMAPGCDEKVDREFLSWVWNFPARSRGRILSQLKEYPEKRIVVLRSSREAERFIRDAEAGV